MTNPTSFLARFFARNSLYFVVPGAWFAYVGGLTPFIGAAAGFAVAWLVAIPTLVVRRRSVPERDRLEQLLAEG